MRSKYKAFTLLETLLALSIFVVLLPVVSSFFYRVIDKYEKSSVINREQAQVIFAEDYLHGISKYADSLTIIGDVLVIDGSGTSYEVGVKNKKLYVKQTATRYLTVEPMKVVDYQIIMINNKYYKIKLRSENGEYTIPLVMY